MIWNKVAKEHVECTFIHELMHFILTKLGRSEISKDEALVEQVAGLLHQYITTQKF